MEYHSWGCLASTALSFSLATILSPEAQRLSERVLQITTKLWLIILDPPLSFLINGMMFGKIRLHPRCCVIELWRIHCLQLKLGGDRIFICELNCMALQGAFGEEVVVEEKNTKKLTKCNVLQHLIWRCCQLCYKNDLGVQGIGHEVARLQ